MRHQEDGVVDPPVDAQCHSQQHYEVVVVVVVVVVALLSLLLLHLSVVFLYLLP
jgi:hypothetical protein